MEAIACSNEIHMVIGGYHYYLDTDDLLEHPESYFAHLLKDEWTKDKTAIVTLNRNGRIFRYVHFYLFTGYMDPNRKLIYDLDVLMALRTEADFYGLPELVRLCDDRLKYNTDKVITKETNLGLTCASVCQSEENATDALVMAMDIFRPPTIATSRLDNYLSDSLESFSRSVPALIKNAQESGLRSIRSCKFAHKCFKTESYGFKLGSNMREILSKWPLSTEEPALEVSIEDTQVFIYESEGYCAKREPVLLRDGLVHGSVLYIFNSEHTGGRITTKVNGEEVSIEKPGECMALLPGCSYSVETVTSGHLVLFEYKVILYPYESYDDSDEDEEGDSMEKQLVWQVRDTYSAEITPGRSAALTQAINTALETYAGVVICLSSYYPAGHSSNTARICETDPAQLKGFDTDLYEHFGVFYEVTVVTVAIAVNDRSTARVLDFPRDADMKLKVVAPMQSVSLDHGKSGTMLLTGLLCFAR